MEQPKMPFAQIIYGEIVYWLCVLAALICTVGPVIALANVDNNQLNPHYLFSAIWEGKKAEEVWAATGGKFPGGHFWLDSFTLGDGFTQFGLVLGGGVAFPALIAAAIAYLLGKPRKYFWALMALWVAALVAVSMVGLIQGH
jgi:hypothetical protein